MRPLGVAVAVVAVIAAALYGAVWALTPEPRVLIRVYYEHGNAASVARESVYLEVGSSALDAHFAEFPARDPARVRLVGTNTCRTYAEFVATPGSAWAIWLRDDGTTTVEANAVIEASSANGSRKRTIPCPATRPTIGPDLSSRGGSGLGESH